MSNVKIGVTRIVVTPGDGPFKTVECMVQNNDDILDIELPEGEYIFNLWVMVNGETVLNLPMEMIPHE